MSTRPGKSPSPTDLTADVSAKARERVVTERDPVEDGDHPPVSPQAANSGWPEQLAAERRDEIISDRDLERLEASLRSLQRREAAGRRLPRATPLRPVPELPPVDAGGRRHGGARSSADGLRSPLSLEPERPVPPPMTSRRHNLRGPLCIFAASILAAPIAYYFLVGGLAPPSGSAPGPQIEAFVQRIIESQWTSVGQQRPSPPGAQGDDPETAAPGKVSSQQTETSQTATISEGATGATSQPTATGAESPSASKAVRALDPEELKLLTRQGEQFASAGDLVTARILFQRAAEAGDATAAMALGATYDPNVLAKLGVIGMRADVEKARSWYQKAESQGSAQATRRLQALANR